MWHVLSSRSNVLHRVNWKSMDWSPYTSDNIEVRCTSVGCGSLLGLWCFCELSPRFSNFRELLKYLFSELCSHPSEHSPSVKNFWTPKKFSWGFIFLTAPQTSFVLDHEIPPAKVWIKFCLLSVFSFIHRFIVSLFIKGEKNDF